MHTHSGESDRNSATLTTSEMEEETERGSDGTTGGSGADPRSLENMVAMLLEDRRAMQANVTSLLGAIKTMGRTRREMTELSRSENDIKLQKLTESDNIEAFLTTFERMMLAYEIGQERWAYKLAPNLTGKAHAAMPTEEAGNYEALKVAILRRYDINQETYRQTSRKDSETYRDLAVRLMDLLKKWMKDHMESVQAVLEQVAIEQLSNKLPPEVHVWVQDRRPKTVLKAGELADE